MIRRWIAVLLLTQAILFADIQFNQNRQARAVAAGLAATAGVIFPGLGHLFAGRPLEALGWLGATAGAASFNGGIAFNIWMYSSYSAWKFAKPQTSMIKDNHWFSDYMANYNPANILDPIGGPLLVAYAGPAAARSGFRGATNFNNVLENSFVGFGEEGLFRGWLYPAMTDVFGGKFGGALVSSILFAAAHIPIDRAQGRSSAALIPRFLVGMVFCWQISNNRYDIRKNIFAHTWIDVFIIGAESNILGGKDPRVARVGNGAAAGWKWYF